MGAVIGNYQLLRRIGEGGMGAVYLAQHTLLGRRAAVKVLLPALSINADVVQRFFNEARAVTSISDPGIVQVFDFGYHVDGSAYLVMEYLEGEPLDRRLSRLGRLPVVDALRLCRQVATSLAAAHAQHIVHRDLKPENIFLVHDPEVPSGERCKILDFGVAKLSEQQSGKVKTSLGTLMGTPLYMSPEQCRGVTGVDHRSDIYALGCVLFHLITGRPPFDGEGAGDIISAHIREPAPAPSSRHPAIDADVDALVLRCLAKQPGERIQTMVALSAELGARLAKLASSDASPHLLATIKLPALPAQLRREAPPMPTPAAAPTPPPGTVFGTATQYGTPRITATTLGGSSGQAMASPPSRPRWQRYAAMTAGALTVVIVAVAMRGSPTPVVASHAGSAPPVPPAKVVDPPPVIVDAGVAREVAEPRARIEDMADAAVAVAPPVTPASPPAAPPASHRPARKPPPESRHDKPSSASKPLTPVAVNPPPVQTSRCSPSEFARVYNAGAPSETDLNSALSRLRACHDNHDMNDADFARIQKALVAKL